MKLLGYAPDLDTTIEGVITDCSAFVPDVKGMVSAPSAQQASAAALSAACYGAAAVKKLDNTSRMIAGTAAALYELSGGAWTDVTRTVGGAYSLSADNRWRFAQFGDTTLAVSKTDILQYSSSSNFANVAGAPKADIVETVGYFVFLANTTEGTYGDSPNRWWCAALGNYTDWTPSVSTQCATGILTSAPGRIFAAKRFGEQIVFYKQKAMYLGTYVGAPVIWNMQQVPGEIGCSSQDGVVNIGTDQNPVHLFMGDDDFWVFDGSRPTSIGSPVRKTVFSNLYAAYAYRIKTVHDQKNKRVYFYYPSLGGNGAVDSCVVYNYKTNTWGRDDRTIEAALEYISGGITYDTWSSVAATYDTLPTTISYDSPFYSSGTPTPAIFDTTHKINTLDGVSTTSSFTTGDFGDDSAFSLIQRVKPKFQVAPTSATMTNYYKNSLGDTLVQDATVSMGVSRFDLLRAARWHRLKFDFVGNSTLNEINIVAQDGGYE